MPAGKAPWHHMPCSSPHQQVISELISYANERRHLYVQQQAITLHQNQHVKGAETDRLRGRQKRYRFGSSYWGTYIQWLKKLFQCLAVLTCEAFCERPLHLNRLIFCNTKGIYPSYSYAKNLRNWLRIELPGGKGMGQCHWNSFFADLFFTNKVTF